MWVLRSLIAEGYGQLIKYICPHQRTGTYSLCNMEQYWLQVRGCVLGNPYMYLRRWAPGYRDLKHCIDQ